MKRNKIAMLLAMALTVTQSVAVPVAAEELTVDVSDDVDAEVTVEADETDSEESGEAEVSIQEEAEDSQDVDFAAGEDTAEDALEAEEVQETFSDGVGAEEKKYEFSYDFAQGHTGNESMLPNSEMRIHTCLMDATDDNDWKEISSYEVKIQPSAETENYAGAADVSLEGTDIVIKSHSKTGFFAISAKVLIDGAEVCNGTVYFNINEYVIMPENIMDADGNVLNPQVGEKIDIVKDMKPQVFRYEDGKKDLTPVNDDDIKIVIASYKDDETGELQYDYDMEGWNWISVSGQELPILERVSKGSTWFALTAMEKDAYGGWSQIARRDYQVDSLDDNGNNGDYDDGNHGDDSEEKSSYALQVDYADTIGNGAMLPNSEMTITTNLADKRDYSMVNDYRLEIVEQSKFAEATVTADGKNLLMKSGGSTGIGFCYVSVQIPDGNGGYTEVFKKDIYFDVSELMLVPQTLTDKTGKMINPAVGEEVNLAKFGVKLVQYKDGKGDPIDIDGDDIKIVVSSWTDEETGEQEFDYDDNAWELKEVEGQDLPIVTRKAGYNTWIALTAMKDYGRGDWGQIARKIYRIDPTGERHSHTMDAGTIVKESGCTDGLRVYKCTSCDKEVREVLLGKGHTEVKDAAVEATCESEGKTEGSHCSVCGEVLKAQKAIPAKGHTEVKDAGVEATCEREGKTEGIRCSVCGKVLKTQETVPAKGHTEVKDAAVEATCEREGKTEGSHCSVCGKVFKKQKTVAKLPATISLTASSLIVKVGQSTTAFKASGFVAGDYVTKVASNNTGIVKISSVKSNGTFKLTAGKKAGSATVTVYLASSKTASFKVIVQKSAVKTTKITTTTKTLTLAKGASYTKLASSVVVTPVTSSEKVTYSSSNTKVATVSSKGVVKGVKAGTAKITVKSGSKKVVVTVKVTGVKTTKLSGVPTAKTVARGKTFKIKAVATPRNTDEKITYTSSNKKIATVTSAGVVKGLRKGTTIITVRSGSKKMTCKVTVK